MYDRYGPWHGHDSAPQMGPFTGLADAQKKKTQIMECWVCGVVGESFEAKFNWWIDVVESSRPITDFMICAVSPMVYNFSLW
jgi:hypothetical protein